MVPKMNRNLIIVSLFLIVGIALSACGAKENTKSADYKYQTVSIKTGVLSQTIAGIGSVRAGQSTILNWQTNGMIAEVLVEEGQLVVAGDRLASLNQASLSPSVILAQSDYLDALVALDAFYETYAELAVAQSKKAVADAQQALHDAEYQWLTLNAPAQTTDIDQAYADVVLAEQTLDAARDRYEPYAQKPATNVTRAQLLAAVADAEEVYNSALRTYNYLIGEATDLESSQAQADLALAERGLIDAQEELERLFAGPTEAEVSALEAHVAAALVTLNQAFVDAPFSGTITLVAAQVGDLVNAGDVAFQLDNLETLYVDVNINEMDISNVKAGQAATIRFDALKELEFEGQVVRVGLNGDASSGVVNYLVTVEVLAVDESIMTGMTAEVNIIVSESEAALLIPNEAVRLVDGVQVVYMMDTVKGLQPVPIQLGSSSDTHSVVIKGKLTAGDLIVLNPTQTDVVGGEKFNLDKEDDSKRKEDGGGAKK